MTKSSSVCQANSSDRRASERRNGKNKNKSQRKWVFLHNMNNLQRVLSVERCVLFYESEWKKVGKENIWEHIVKYFFSCAQSKPKTSFHLVLSNVQTADRCFRLSLNFLLLMLESRVTTHGVAQQGDMLADWESACENCYEDWENAKRRRKIFNE